MFVQGRHKEKPKPVICFVAATSSGPLASFYAPESPYIVSSHGARA